MQLDRVNFQYTLKSCILIILKTNSIKLHDLKGVSMKKKIRALYIYIYLVIKMGL